MKRRSTVVIIVSTLLLALIVPAFEASAARADRAVSKVKCRPTKAVAMTPKKVDPPTALLKRAPRSVTLFTNCGEITIQVFYKKAPITLTVLTTLMNAGYYDQTLCHRVTTELAYVLQCGDPMASGAGDPGFRYRDENLPSAGENNYPEGTVAMANSGPNTNGSQFFLVYQDSTFGPNYTMWGRVTSGLDIVKYIASGGVRGGGTDGRPNIRIAIERVEVR